MPSPNELKQLEIVKRIEQLKETYERLFSTDDGKKVLEDIAISGCLKRSAFNTDALIMAFSEGKRDLAQNIVDMAHKADRKKPKETKARS